MSDNYNISIGTVNDKVMIQQNSQNSSQSIIMNDYSELSNLIDTLLSKECERISIFGENSTKALSILEDIKKSIQDKESPSKIKKLLSGLKNFVIGTVSNTTSQLLINQLMAMGV